MSMRNRSPTLSFDRAITFIQLQNKCSTQNFRDLLHNYWYSYGFNSHVHHHRYVLGIISSSCKWDDLGHSQQRHHKHNDCRQRTQRSSTIARRCWWRHWISNVFKFTRSTLTRYGITETVRSCSSLYSAISNLKNRSHFCGFGAPGKVSWILACFYHIIITVIYIAYICVANG